MKIRSQLRDGEVIRKVKGYQHYWVSNFGRVFSTWKNGRELKPGRDTAGYLLVCLCRDGKATAKRIHTLVLGAFGPSGNGLMCRHLDGSRDNNHIDNLRWGTSAENQADKLIHGTDNRGSKHSLAKLTEEDIQTIRYELKLGTKQKVLAKRYGVVRRTISSIKTGRNWSWLQPNEGANI